MGGIGWFVVGAALTTAACAPSKPPLIAAFPREVTLYVAVSSEVALTDSGNVLAMVEALESDLRDHQRTVSIVTARLNEPPPLPRVELHVLSSSSGDQTARGAGRLSQLLFPVAGVALIGAGSGHMLVDAYVVAGNGRRPRYLGRYSGSSFGALSDEEIAAGQEIGHDIAESLYRTPD